MKPLSNAGYFGVICNTIFFKKSPIKSQFWLLAFIPAPKYPKEVHQQEGEHFLVMFQREGVNYLSLQIT